MIAAGSVLVAGMALQREPPFGVAIWLLALLAVAAAQFPLQLEPNEQVDTTAGVFVCLLLLLSTASATWLVAVTSVAGSSISALTLLRRTTVRPPARLVLSNVAFNAAQVAIAIFIGGSTRDLIVRAQAPAALADALAIAAAAVLFYLVNNLAVAMAVGLDIARSPLRILSEAVRDGGLFYAILFVGSAASYELTRLVWWGPLVMALAVVATYIGLRRRVERLQKTFASLERLADSIDARDPYTANHSRRVAAYCVEIARQLGLNDKETEVLRAAARVHDLGKAIVPPEVLLKEGSLTAEEWDLVKRHPEEGYRMLEPFSGYERGRNLVLVHHERYDGGGYPNGIQLRELHLLAQIIPVADSVDAMRSDRPYRAGLPDAVVASKLVAGQGTQWNPDVVDAALAALGLRSASDPESGLRPRYAAPGVAGRTA